MGRRWPELRAFLLAPLVAPLGYWAGLLVWGVVSAVRTGGVSPLPSLASAIEMLGLVLMVGAPIAYAAALVSGLPLYLVLRRAGRLGRAPLWVGGGVVGVAVAHLIAPELRGELFSIPFPPWAAAVLGVLTAEAFWRLHPRAGIP